MLNFDSTPEVLVEDPRERRRRARRGNAGRIIVYLLLGLVILALGGGGIYTLNFYLRQGGSGHEAAVFRTNGNFTLQPAGKPWVRNGSLERAFRTNLAFSRSNPASGMALFFRDYKTRSASDAELLDEALKRLRAYFVSDSLEYEDPFQTPIRDRPLLGGQPAALLKFLGVRDEVRHRGVVYLLAHRGYAYWFFTWGPERDQELLEPSWETLRLGFSLGNNREGWQPRPRESESFMGDKAKYQLDYVKGLWKRAEDPKDYDPEAELALRGFEPVVDEDTGKKTTVEFAGKLATVEVLILPAAADLQAAHQAALDHILKRQQENHPSATLKPVNDPKTGKALLDSDRDVGSIRGHLSKQQLALTSEHDRYLLLGVVRMDEKVVAILCECEWSRRDFWDQEFKELLDSLRPAGTRRKPAAN